MTKSSGLGDQLYVDGFDLSGDTGALGSISGGPATIDVTAIDKSAPERIGGRRDGRLEWTSFFNDATDRAHPVLSALPTTDRVATYMRGATLGNPAAALVAKQLNYDGQRGADGEFTLDVVAESNDYGIQWGVNLTAGIATQGAAGSLTSVDLTDVSTDFGAQAFVHLFSFTGTSITVTVQDSADDAAFASIGLTTTALTAVGAERIATAATENIRRYVRVTTTGTFSAATFAVVFIRNTTEVVF